MLLMLSAMYPYFINKVVERDAENGKKRKVKEIYLDLMGVLLTFAINFLMLWRWGFYGFFAAFPLLP